MGEQSARLTEDLKTLQANVSTAQEFITNAFGASEEMLLSAPQLQVLHELAQKDAEADQNRDHESRLGQIRASLLQTGTHASGVDAQSILDSLNSALDELAKEQNAS